MRLGFLVLWIFLPAVLFLFVLSDYTERIMVLTAERDALENRIVSLEAQLPCPPEFSLSCQLDEEAGTGLYQDGVQRAFRYTVNGADLGKVRCYLSNGKEVLP